MNNLKTLEDITLFSVVEDEREEEERETDEIAELIDIRKIDVKNYEKYLIRKNMAENTIKSYTWTVRNFFKRYNRITKRNLLAYKGYLMENYSPRTVNLRILGINNYLKYIRKTVISLQCIKIQQKPFLEDVISLYDYKKLIKYMKKHNHMTMYFITKYMACTGARVSEVVEIKRNHVMAGYYDIYSKGGKLRRIYINKRLANETLEWLDAVGIEEGYIFKNKNGLTISPRGISKELKDYAKACGGIPLETVYPHSFRHMFAICFLERHNDLTLLSDLLGHASVETTKVYTRRTSHEQMRLINQVVNWN